MDADLAFALQMQAQEDAQSAAAWTQNNAFSPPAAFKSNGASPMSIVDPRWEAIDPTPDVRAMFLEFNKKYFWGKLEGCEVRWSPRMTSCAGICCYEGRGGLCSVRLSEPLLKLRPRKDLVETLLHEMIHAYLFVTDNNKDHDGHGPEFCKHMNRLNKETGTNITIYHTFHDEVNNYKVHWWKCNGPCQRKAPYFGMVKRAMNRAPSPRDPWWHAHKQNCNGEFIKVKEPDGFGQKKTKLKEIKSPEKPKGVPDIRTMFGGKNDIKPDASSKKPRPASTTGKKSTTLINPGRPNSAPIDSDSGKENKLDSDNSLGSPKASIHGGVLNRNKLNDDVTVASNTFGKKGISTIFQPVEKPLNDKGNIAKTWKVDNSTKTVNKPNIHTISSSASNSAQDIKEFSGTGYSLTGNKVNEDYGAKRPETIVRRIPGIGLITSERPTATQASAAKSSTHVADTNSIDSERPHSASLFTSDSEIDLAGKSNGGPLVIQSSSSQDSMSPSLLDEVPKRTDVGASSSMLSLSSDSSSAKFSDIGRDMGAAHKDSTNSNEKRTLMPYFTSDDDDSDILFKFKTEASKRRNIETGEKMSYPSVCSKKSRKYKKKRIFGKSTGVNKNSKSKVSTRAADRNDRALGLGDNSDSETTDDEERRSLGSALRITDDSRSANVSPRSVPSRISSRNSDTVSSIASIRLLTDSEQSVTVLSSSDGQESDVKEIVKIESPEPSSPVEVLGVNLDMSGFSAHKRNPRYTTQIKKPIPITPPRPSTSYTGTPGGIKRSSSTELDSVRKRFKFTNTGNDTAMPSGSGTFAPAQPSVSNSQASTGSAFQPYNRANSQENTSDPLVECPSCPGKFKSSEINDHLDTCLDMLPDL